MIPPVISLQTPALKPTSLITLNLALRIRWSSSLREEAAVMNHSIETWNIITCPGASDRVMSWHLVLARHLIASQASAHYLDPAPAREPSCYPENPDTCYPYCIFHYRVMLPSLSISYSFYIFFFISHRVLAISIFVAILPSYWN